MAHIHTYIPKISASSERKSICSSGENVSCRIQGQLFLTLGLTWQAEGKKVDRVCMNGWKHREKEMSVHRLGRIKRLSGQSE